MFLNSIYAYDKYYIESGNNIIEVNELPPEMHVSKWIYRLYQKGKDTKGTNYWGVIDKRSVESLNKELLRSQSFEKNYESFCKCSWGDNTFFNALGPIAVLENSDDTKNKKIPKKLEDIFTQLQILREKYGMLNEKNPLNKFGNSLREYAGNFIDVYNKMSTLHTLLQKYQTEEIKNINKILEDFSKQVNLAEQKFNKFGNNPNDFKCNIYSNLDYCVNLCDFGNHDACISVGNAYKTFHYLGNERKKAGNFYKKACESNSLMGCYRYTYFVSTEDYSEFTKKVFSLSEKMCKEKNGLACYILGELYENGHGIEKDRDLALSYYKKSCDLNEVMGCNTFVYSYQVFVPTPKDYSVEDVKAAEVKARKLKEIACNGGDHLECIDLAYRYIINEDQAKAKAMYIDACDKGEIPSACLDLARFQTLIDSNQDYYLNKACSLPLDYSQYKQWCSKR